MIFLLVYILTNFYSVAPVAARFVTATRFVTMVSNTCTFGHKRSSDKSCRHSTFFVVVVDTWISVDAPVCMRERRKEKVTQIGRRNECVRQNEREKRGEERKTGEREGETDTHGQCCLTVTVPYTRHTEACFCRCTCVHWLLFFCVQVFSIPWLGGTTRTTPVSLSDPLLCWLVFGATIGMWLFVDTSQPSHMV